MELNKCPNCSGKLQPSSNRNKMVCPFCGSEFAMDSTAKDIIESEPINKDWFIYEWDYKKLTDISNFTTTLNSFVRTLNEFNSSAEVEKYMRDYMMNYDAVSAPGLREENMSGIMARISPMLEPGERVILYDDSGMIVKGKIGVVITDKRTLFIEKKVIKEMKHTAIPYLYFEYSIGLPSIRLGEKYSNSIGIFNSHFDLQGTVAALVCFYSFEIDRSRPKIRLI
ncbi:MAG: hypothetical protein K6A80_04290 [Saccharofermentans sp.]|nr:hypothetical protein [Saccharofermentans sp.]